MWSYKKHFIKKMFRQIDSRIEWSGAFWCLLRILRLSDRVVFNIILIWEAARRSCLMSNRFISISFDTSKTFSRNHLISELYNQNIKLIAFLTFLNLYAFLPLTFPHLINAKRHFGSWKSRSVSAYHHRMDVKQHPRRVIKVSRNGIWDS